MTGEAIAFALPDGQNRKPGGEREPLSQRPHRIGANADDYNHAGGTYGASS